MRTLLLFPIAVCLLVLGFVNPAHAIDGIELKGTVMGIKSLDGALCDEPGKDCYVISLLLQFYNRTDEPIIILRPLSNFRAAPDAQTINVFFTDSLTGSGTGSSVAINPPSLKPKSRYDWDYITPDPVSVFIGRLKYGKPGSTEFVTVLPRSYAELNVQIWMTNGFTTRIEQPVEKIDPPIRFAEAKYPGLVIEYKMSLNGSVAGMENLDNARKRWRSIGNLYFDDNGEYSIRSEVILLPVP